MTDHDTAARGTSRAAVENDEAKARVQASPADENPVIQAVTEGAAPSYASDAINVDPDTGIVSLSSASLPQLTMPELQGLTPDDIVVPEEGDPALYGIDEEAEVPDALSAQVQRGKDVAEKNLSFSTRMSDASRKSADKASRADNDDPDDNALASPSAKSETHSTAPKKTTSTTRANRQGVPDERAGRIHLLGRSGQL